MTRQDRIDAIREVLRKEPYLNNKEVELRTGIHRRTVCDLRNAMGGKLHNSRQGVPFCDRLAAVVEIYDKNPMVTAAELTKQLGGPFEGNRYALACIKRGCRRQTPILDSDWPLIHQRIQAGERRNHIAQEYGLTSSQVGIDYDRYVKSLEPVRKRTLMMIPFSRAGELFGNTTA